MRDKLSARTVDRKQVSLVKRSEIVVPRDPVADAWHAAKCPAYFNPREHVTFGEWLRWSCRLFVRSSVPRTVRRFFSQITCRHRWVPDIGPHKDPSIAWCFHCQATARVSDG